MRRQMAVLVAAAAACLAGATAPAGAATLFTVTGHGYGHGIGLGQYGALGYAQHGWDWQRIVLHYYPGTVLGQAPSALVAGERVLLESSMPAFDFAAGVRITIRDAGGGLSAATALQPGSYTLQPGLTAGRWRIVDAVTGLPVLKNLVGPVDVSPWGRPLQILDTMPLGWAGGHWWGWFRVAPNAAGTALSLVEDVPMETYLRGVVPSEMPSSWLPQALAAQAVVARSYAYATQHPSGAWDVVDGVGEAYGPVEHWSSATDAAVAATAGQVVLYRGAAATTFYSSSSGGLTDSEVGAWDCSGCGTPYLQPVVDPYDSAGGNPNHSWRMTPQTPAAIARELGFSRPVVALSPVIGSRSRRVLRLDVVMAGGGTATVDGYAAQQLLGLRSTYFRIAGVTLTGPASVPAGHLAVLSGSVWPLPRGAVALQRRIGTGPWVTRIAALRISADGSFRVTTHPTGIWSYRLVPPGGAASPVVTVAVG